MRHFRQHIFRTVAGTLPSAARCACCATASARMLRNGVMPMPAPTCTLGKTYQTRKIVKILHSLDEPRRTGDSLINNEINNDS